MTFAINEYVVKHSAKAAADLSALAFTFVKLDASGNVVAVAADTDVPIGVLQNAPKLGDTAEIIVVGGTKIKSSAALAVGIALGTTAAGLGVARTMGVDVTKYVLGTIISASANANELASALIDCVGVGRAV